MKSHTAILLFIAAFIFWSCKDGPVIQVVDDQVVLTETTSVKPVHEKIEEVISEIDEVNQPISVNEITQVVEQIERASQDGDTPYFEQLVDWESILSAATVGIEVPIAFRRLVGQKFNQIKPKLCQILTNDGLDFVGELDKHSELVFRVRGKTGLDYKVVYLHKNENGEIKVADVENLAAGSNISGLLRSSIVFLLAEVDQSSQTGMSQRVQSIKEIRKISEYSQAGQFDAMFAAWYGLKKEIRNEKKHQLVWLKAVAAIPGQGPEYVSALRRYRKLFPQDPSLDFVLLDLHILENRFEEVHRTLDRIRNFTKDPYIEFFRGWAYLLEGDIAAAKSCVDRWAEYANQGSEYWEMVLAVANGSQDNQLTVEALVELEGTFGKDYSSVLRDPEYSDFVQSFEGQMWLTRRLRSQ